MKKNLSFRVADAKHNPQLLEMPIFYCVSRRLVLEEFNTEDNLSTGKTIERVVKVNNSFKGTCDDNRKRKEAKWELAKIKLAQAKDLPVLSNN